MIAHAWTVVTGLAIVDRDKNNVSLVDVLERITINAPTPDQPTKVLVPIQFALVSLFYRVNSDVGGIGRCRLKHLVTNGEEIINEIEVDLTKAQRVRSILRSDVIPVVGPATQYFVVELQTPGQTGWTEVGRVPLEIAFSTAGPKA
jgi:hypothetical protein